MGLVTRYGAGPKEHAFPTTYYDPAKNRTFFNQPENHSWEMARKVNHMGYNWALAKSILVFLFWHMLQPTLYYLVFFDAYSTLNPMQQLLGKGVLIREGIYLASVLICTAVNPSFLLVNIHASYEDATRFQYGQSDVRGGGLFLMMYVLSPERFMAFVVFSLCDATREGGCVATILSNVKKCYICISVVLDLCGLGALGAGLGARNLPSALAVGYTAAALSSPTYLVFRSASNVATAGPKRTYSTAACWEKPLDKLTKEAKDWLLNGPGGLIVCAGAFVVPYILAGDWTGW